MSNDHKPHRRSIRLPGYDYSWGASYFVTICVANRACRLGEIINGNLKKSPEGEIVQQCWDRLPAHYHNIILDAFTIMPNHLHFVIVINQSIGSDLRFKGLTPLPAAERLISQEQRMGGLPEIVRALKSFSGREINRYHNTPGQPFWQRNYFDHIIRNERALGKIRDYIQSNPLNWRQDKENSVRTGKDEFDDWLRTEAAQWHTQSGRV